jgi:hypothetical protein
LPIATIIGSAPNRLIHASGQIEAAKSIRLGRGEGERAPGHRDAALTTGLVVPPRPAGRRRLRRRRGANICARVRRRRAARRDGRR